MTKSLYFMDNVASFRACGWNTFALDRDALVATQREMRERHPGEALVVSCQRVEAYGFGPCECNAPGAWHGREAVDHLAEVAAGLHSAVLGEAQILGQVRDGFAAATGRVRRLGDAAISAARDLRRRTDFNSHAGHLLDRALKVGGVHPGGSILVLGTGQMGRLVAERAREVGFSRIIVAGRARREGMAEEFVPLARIARAPAVDVIVGCLGSGAAELKMELLPAARLVIDLGTPRNFASGSDDGDRSSGHGENPYPRPLGLAELMADEAKRPHARRRRGHLRRELRTIVDTHLAAAAEDGGSLVGALRARVEAVRSREAQRMRRLHPDVPEAAIEAMTRSLVNQLMHRPTERLRRMDADAGRDLVALFGD